VPPQIWTITIPDPVRGPDRARRLEEEGYDGLLVVDSQCMAPDSFVGLTTMALATQRIGIGTGVSNPATRHPSVLAGAAASLNVVSGGRVVLGIGRGDSSLFHIGRDPAPLSEFEPYLAQLCAYCRGEAVDIDGTESRLRWLPYWDAPPVPVDVACTGPRITRYAACVADRITFAVGCDPDRLRWSIDLARTARTEAGLDPDGIEFGAYVQAAAHPDRTAAIDLVRGITGVFAHFSGMKGSTPEGQPPSDRTHFEALDAGYDKRHHAMNGAEHARALDPAFIERFAAVGPPDTVIERLREMVDAGAQRLVFSPPSRDSDAEAAQVAARLFTEEVMPALR
jgi:5,10-methylenetetrahydromethanopterin reductase